VEEWKTEATLENGVGKKKEPDFKVKMNHILNRSCFIGAEG
jgi:hypothetical protein